jgi:N,N'-diacetyllegionaminate synthase
MRGGGHHGARRAEGARDMKIFGKNLERDLVVIAEIGVNHEGDPEVASKLVRAAAEAGADAVKFQSYTPERYISQADPERFARVGRFALDIPTHRRLAAEAKEAGIAFLSTAVTEDWVPLLAELSPVLKIASGDLTFEPVIRAAARSGRQVILSVGLGTIEEIDRSVGWFADEIGPDADLRERLALLHCVVAYPTPVEQANVLSVRFLAERYNLHVGYSNHVIGPEACYAAVAIGAPIVEVHFTDKKTGRTFRDHALSYEPSDLRSLVDTLGRIRASLGRIGKQRAEAELGNLTPARKGIIAARELPPGTIVAESDLMYSRPVFDFSSNDLALVIGRKTQSPIGKGMPVRAADLAEG